jgi:hypothetical protein
VKFAPSPRYALAPAAEVLKRTGLTIDELRALAARDGAGVQEFVRIDATGERTAMLRLPEELAPPVDGVSPLGQ